MNISIPDSCTFWFNASSLGILSVVIYTFFKVNHMFHRFPKICEALTRISEILLQKDLAKDFVFSASPIKLTEKGEQAVQEAKFMEFYNSNKKILYDRISKDNPKTIADLEEISKSLMLQIEDTLPNFEPIKQFAYQRGEPIAKILYACAVKLRDLAAQELKITE